MEYNAFMWNESSGIYIKSFGLLGKHKKADDDQHFVRRPFIGAFRVRNYHHVIS